MGKQENLKKRNHAVSCTYFIDGDGGNDSNPGTSSEAPWKTLKKAGDRHYGPGDRILLKRGCRWTDPFVLSGSGTAEKPIELSTYGEGPRPVIAAEDTRKGICLTLNNVSDWKISSLELKQAKIGLYLRYTDFRGHSNINISDCLFQDMPDRSADANFHNQEFAWSSGIFIGGILPEKKITVLKNLTIRSNRFVNAGIGIIHNWYWPDQPRFNILTNVVLENNIAENCYGGGFAFTDTSDLSIRNFEIRNSGGKSDFGTTGAFLQSCRNVVIENCLFEGTRAIDCHDGAGMDFEGNNRQVLFRNNRVQNNHGPGILFCCTDGVNEEIEITDNHISGNGASPHDRDYACGLLNWTDRNEKEIFGKNKGRIKGNTIISRNSCLPFSAGTARAGVPFEWDGFEITGNRLLSSEETDRT
ncbi:MAG: right-handed parallel beta-helix repeat-containing protein [Spirochaetales bacterium]|nr:right-handed parallel beta-helix repeat-containing protein [Spirochaetales bacterium]